MLYGNLACFAFLIASYFFLKDGHECFAIGSFIVAVISGVRPKTDNDGK